MRLNCSRALHPLFAMLATALCVSCATSTQSSTPAQTPESPDSVAFSTPIAIDRGPLGTIVRNFAHDSGHNVVLMNGLEYHFAGPYALDETSPEDLVAQLAQDTGMTLHRNPRFDFICPPGFDSLATFSPSSRLNPAVADIETSVRIGADTPLYAALALLSHSHKVTLVADNIIASALCGETSLRNVPLGDALDAILRSARLSADTCSVRVGHDFSLFHSPRASLRPDVFANPATAARPAALDRRVTLYLPAPPPDPHRLSESTGAVPLEDCAQNIADQIGMRVEFDRNCGQLPVNPSVMIDVAAETALTLLIQQWPLPYYGFTATDDTVRIVYLGPPPE